MAHLSSWLPAGIASVEDRMPFIIRYIRNDVVRRGITANIATHRDRPGISVRINVTQEVADSQAFINWIEDVRRRVAASLYYGFRGLVPVDGSVDMVEYDLF